MKDGIKFGALKHVVGYAVVLVVAIVGTAQALPGKNTVTSDDIVNKQVTKADLAVGAVRSKQIKDGSVGPADLSQSYYTKAQVNALVGAAINPQELAAALGAYVPRRDLGQYGGVLRWGFIQDLTSQVLVYVDNSRNSADELTVERTATGVYEVTVPRVKADGARHLILVSPQQGQTTAFRACKVFQTASVGDPADTLTVRVRCYDASATLINTDFHIMVMQ